MIVFQRFLCYISTMKYAEVLIPQKIFDDKETLTYSVPDELNLEIGQSVKIPLKNRITSGIVLKIHNKVPSFKTLPIKSIIKEKPLINKTQIFLLSWMSEYYFCPLYKIIKLFIPKRILEGNPIKIRRAAQNRSEAQTRSAAECQYQIKTSSLLEGQDTLSPKNLKLTIPQKKAVDEILISKTNKFLIHGITGSGKTEIYTRLAKYYIEKGKQALILVPEISLTPQIIDYFEKSIGISSAVIHSKLSEGERNASWINIWENQTKLIIGSRSAIFAPFQDLGIIIIDEEHELSYKQENAPRYRVHTIAEKLQSYNPEIKLILGSATPSVETKENLKLSTIELKERIGESMLPEIEIIDMRDEFQKKNFSIFSDRLKEELNIILKKKDQAILFLNRRGSASSMTCRDCGYTASCKDCELPMTYHAKTLASPFLICHHCGKISQPMTLCPTCKSPYIKFLGIGTQKIETEAQKDFPKAIILRADKDTTSKKLSFKNIYTNFKNHKADILIGTQMIAKGLHLPKVNLVGVVLSDIGLNVPDFKTTERNFQLLTQVSGRAGRSKNKGKVIIQTYSPDNIALKFVQMNDYENFFKYEITQRKLLKNPPFSKLAKLLIEDKTFKNCKEKTEKIENFLWRIARELNIAKELEINSYPAYLMKLKNKYRHIILIKDKSNTSIIHKLLEKLSKKYIMDLEIKIDIDPISIT